MPKRPRAALTVSRAISVIGAVAAVLLFGSLARAADPVKKACLGDCKEQGTACKTSAESEGAAAEAACAADPATERECRANAKSAFKASKKLCKAARKDCKRCCKQGGSECLRPADLPPPFATGRVTAPLDLAHEGCLSSDDDVELTTDRGIEVEVDEDTCFAT